MRGNMRGHLMFYEQMMVQMALSAMKKVNLVVMGMDDMEMQFTRIGEMVGIDSESASAKRVREHRARKALEQQQVIGVTMKQDGNGVVTNGNTEIDKEKEIEIEKESDVETDYMQKINNLSVYMVSANRNVDREKRKATLW